MDYVKLKGNGSPKVSSKLCEYRFIRSYANYSLFIYRKGDMVMELLVHVDDIVLASNYGQVSNEFKIYLNACVSIKDLGPLTYFLNTEVTWGLDGMFLCNNTML